MVGQRKSLLLYQRIFLLENAKLCLIIAIQNIEKTGI